MEPDMLPIMTMLPGTLRSIKCLATPIAKRYVPSTFTPHSFFTLSYGYAIASKFSVKPADVTRLSILPWAWMTSAMAALTESGSDTSA